MRIHEQKILKVSLRIYLICLIFFGAVSCLKYENTVNINSARIAADTEPIVMNKTMADLRHADLRKRSLRGADLYKANLREADLREADLREANLQGAWLREARLDEADLAEADLKDANLWGADLWRTDLRGAKNLTVQQLCQVKTLCGAILDPGLEALVKKECPHLLICPVTVIKPPCPPRPINRIYIHNRVTSVINTTNIK